MIGSATVYVQGQPVPLWQNRLDDPTSATVDGGSIVNPPATFVPGFDGNAFAGNASVYVVWDNTDVANIFDAAWNNSLGATIDLFFRGDHWSSHTGDSGLWSVVDRGGGYDGHWIMSVRDGKLRFPWRDSYTNAYAENYLTGVTLADNTTYRLTVRQFNGVFEVYLDGGAYNNSSPVYTGGFYLPNTTTPATCAFPAPNIGTGTSGREMNVGNRSHFFGGTLQSGEWVDNVRVFNGYYTPAEIPVAPPGLPVAVATADVFSGFVPLTVQFDGSASYDTNGGTIITYQWDFDNDGTADDSSGPIVSHQYSAAGDYVCKLTVTDNDSNTAIDLVPIKVYALPATGLLSVTAMEPSGTLVAGSYPLTSVTTQRIGSVPTFTANANLVGPPDVAHVLVVGTGITGGGAGAATAADALVGLELGSTISGLSGDGKFLTGWFADSVPVQPDGTPAPEVFMIESSASTDDFRIQLLTSGPGVDPPTIAAEVQVRTIDYASTSTVIGTTPRGGVGLDLDALGVTSIRGVRITGADGFGGASGVDPVLVAAVYQPCNTPFADADGDGDVDQVDFAAFQSCYTGSNPPAGAFDVERCFCFDHEGGDSDVDELDYADFEDYATGPGIPWR
jgi:PKD repeat protein